MTDATLSIISVALSAALAAAAATYIAPTYEKAQAQTLALQKVATAQHLAVAKTLYSIDYPNQPPAISSLADLLDADGNTAGAITTAAIVQGWEQDEAGYFVHAATPAECDALGRAGALNDQLQCDGERLRIRYTP